ncbi:MAG: hypothetical protein IKB53_03130 [Oscillospiraceae bacterium]|nr:hypothetical protein [Oscillospiraceae bacterium]
MRIEILFPEVANLYGDLMNMDYLCRCLGGAEVIRTSLHNEPAFVSDKVDLIYMGSVTEEGQRLAVEALMPYRDKLVDLIEEGQLFLITGNALEIFGKHISRDDGTELDCLGLFPTVAKHTMMKRYNALYLGKFRQNMDIVGFKSQFGHSYGEAEPLFTTFRGAGLNLEIPGEGLRRNNFLATYLTGPLLVLNPPFTKHLMGLMGVSEPTLCFEDAAMELYRDRVREYGDPKTGIEYH